MFGHWLQILLLLGLALLVFGPKRVVEMGSSLGKAWKEFRDSTKDINFTNLLNTDDEPQTPPRVTPFTSEATPSTAPNSEPTVVDGTVERREAAGE